MDLAALVRDAAARTPDKPALVFRERATTWRELDARVDRCARALADLGLVPGDRVALVLANTPAFVASYFGALRGGFVVVAVNPGYTAAELEHVLGDSGARVAITYRTVAPTINEVADEIDSLEHVLVVDSARPAGGAHSFERLLSEAGPEPVECPRGDEDLAVLIYTSGTSGRPKGAMLSHRALLANLEQVSSIEPPIVSEDDVVLLVLPLFHIYGLNGGLGIVAKAGATGVLVERFDPVDTLAEVRRHGVTNVPGAPPMYVAWSMLPDLGESLAGARLLVSGAAPLPASVLERVLDSTGHHVFEGYGLTETAPVLTTTLMSEAAKPDSIGRPIPGVELRLLDEEGNVASDEDPGEITVRGGNLFSGYWPDGAGGPDAQGWFRTGDVAYADEDGDLHLVDRIKELILVSGFNVYPREVEEALLRHPDVAEAAAIGIPHPYTGESVKAVVVAKPGAELTQEEVVEHCAAMLARFKCPTTVEFVAELPHSATGKVAKRQLRELEASS